MYFSYRIFSIRGGNWRDVESSSCLIEERISDKYIVFSQSIYKTFQKAITNWPIRNGWRVYEPFTSLNTFSCQIMFEKPCLTSITYQKKKKTPNYDPRRAYNLNKRRRLILNDVYMSCAINYFFLKKHKWL